VHSVLACEKTERITILVSKLTPADWRAAELNDQSREDTRLTVLTRAGNEFSGRFRMQQFAKAFRVRDRKSRIVKKYFS
jgi:hypothetical protein